MLHSPTDKTTLRNWLSEGLGVENIAKDTGLHEADIREEIQHMRKTGELARLYAAVRDKARRARG